MTGRRKREVLKDAAALATAVAEGMEQIAAPGAPVAIALSGGSTPKHLYERLAASPFRDRVHWNAIEFFFSDERAVPPDHPDSNFGMASRALLAHVPSRTHRMPADTGDAEAYERLVRERIFRTRTDPPVFDLILLGIGPDGHTASLFPGTAALKETKRLVVMNDVPQLSTRRMTFTYPLINAARRVWILASGADKREIVSACLSRPDPDRWPIDRVDPDDGELVWWLDEAAAP